MLAERILCTVLLMLLILPWPDEPEMGSLGAHLTLLSLRAFQRPEFAALPLPFAKPFCGQRWPEGCPLGKLWLVSKSGNFSVSPCPEPPFGSANGRPDEERDCDAARIWEPVECDAEWECGIALRSAADLEGAVDSVERMSEVTDGRRGNENECNCCHAATRII
jgi:hypothetical protein